MIKYLNLILIIVFMNSCQQKGNSSMVLENKQEIVDSAKAIVQKIFELSNNHKFVEGLDYYANDTEAYYVNNGTVLNLSDLKKSYENIAPSVEVLENSIDSWNTKVLSEDVVLFTLPVRLKIKLKGIPEYNGQLVWSGVLQKIKDKWVVVQSHESWLNCVEVNSALSSAN
ncbi:nuclear transport factor 2 family protein [Tenacibaculum sp. 190524A02b]